MGTVINWIKQTSKQITQNARIQSMINIFQLSIIGVVSYFLLLFRTEKITGLGYVIICGIVFYILVYIIEFNRNCKDDKKKRILFVKKVFRLIYTTIYLTAIMIEVIKDAGADNTRQLVIKGLLFIWITLWGIRDFWIQKIIRKLKGSMPQFPLK